MSYVEDVARGLSARLAAALGISEPADAWRAFYAQITNETAGGDPSTRGVRNRNPLNLKDPWPDRDWAGEIGMDDDFAVFGSLDAGIAASVQNYQAPNYAGVVQAFKSGDVRALVSAIERSPWDAGHYGDPLGSDPTRGLDALLPAPGSGEPVGPRGPEGPSTPPTPTVCRNALGIIVPCGPSSGSGGVPIPNPFDGIGDAIDSFKTTIGDGARSFAIAGVVISAVVVLGYGGLKRTLD